MTPLTNSKQYITKVIMDKRRRALATLYYEKYKNASSYTEKAYYKRMFEKEALV